MNTLSLSHSRQAGALPGGGARRPSRWRRALLRDSASASLSSGSFRQIGRADPDKSRQTGKRLMTTHARGHGCDDDGAKGLGFGGARRSALYASLSPVAIHEITTPSGGSELVAAAESVALHVRVYLGRYTSSRPPTSQCLSTAGHLHLPRLAGPQPSDTGSGHQRLPPSTAGLLPRLPHRIRPPRGQGTWIRVPVASASPIDCWTPPPPTPPDPASTRSGGVDPHPSRRKRPLLTVGHRIWPLGSRIRPPAPPTLTAGRLPRLPHRIPPPQGRGTWIHVPGRRTRPPPNRRTPALLPLRSGSRMRLPPEGTAASTSRSSLAMAAILSVCIDIILLYVD
ncbi:hypothetical protein DAI22_08g127450 [Oryza sativa Japonica Group]|nr:hypothetical protein DAI22_08g127450 [Oryza sativa Japonica Group]